MPTGGVTGGVAGAEGAADEAAGAAGDVVRLPDGLADLVVVLDRACDELFAAVPFLGDQETGAAVNAGVDELVSAIRLLRDDAEDLRRVVQVSERGRRGRTDALEH